MTNLNSTINNLGLVVILTFLLGACSSSDSPPKMEPPGPDITECEQNNTCDDMGEGDNGEGDNVVDDEPPLIIKPVIPADQREPLAFDRSFVYQQTSPHIDVLQDCYAADLENACDLSVLPFIGMSALEPSVESIMARTVVTHSWMGLRFSQFLVQLPEEALNLFKPVTVIYIGSENIINSFDATQGKLEISPDLLWLTFGEKSTAFFTSESTGGGGDPAPTLRDDLQFRFAWRLMKGDDWLFSEFNKNEREYADIYPFFAYELYYTTAFAFDRLGAPSSSNTALSESPYDVFLRSDFLLLDGMVNNPEFTNTASGLVRYSELYYGRINDENRPIEPATNSEQQATASFMGSLFSIDGRLNFFSYYIPDSDFENLFAAGMMKYKHGAHVDLGFLELNNRLCDAEVAYGVSNRVASPRVVPRLRYLMETVLGQSTELSTFFETGIGVAEDLPIGVSWCDSAPSQVTDQPTPLLSMDPLLGNNAASVQ